MDHARSGSRKQASLRRKNIDEDQPVHDRSKSAISVEVRGHGKQVEFSLQNQANEDENSELR